MPLDELEEVIDKVVSPERITRWIVRIVLLIVLISVGVTVTKIALHMNSKVNQVTTDRDWFVDQAYAIAGAGVLERLAKEALERHLKEVDDRSGLLSISRKEDRVESRRLSHEILDAQRSRVGLVSEYNSRAGHVTDVTVLDGLPKRVSLSGEALEAF